MTKKAFDPQVYLDSAVNSLTSQLATGDALDTKAGTMLATALAEVALLAAVVAIHKPHSWNWLFAASGVAGLVAAVTCLLGTLWVKTWDSFPTAYDVYTQFDGMDDMRTQVATTISDAYKANKPKMESKALWVKVSMAVVLLQTISFTLAATLNAHTL